MKIEVNNSKVISIPEKSLVVKNSRLYNVTTNEYEAIDGDRVEFCTVSPKGHKFYMAGIVEGYTCGRRIKLRGIHELYAVAEGTKKEIDFISVITDSDSDGVYESSMPTPSKPLEIKTEAEIEWESVLSA